MPRNKLISIYLGISICLLQSCASITGSSNQGIMVTAICDSSKVIKGAFCTLTSDKGQWFIETPGSVLIQKSFGDMLVSCKYGDALGTQTISSSTNMNNFGNVLAGGFIGAAVDAGTGSGYNYPPMVTVNMHGNCQASQK